MQKQITEKELKELSDLVTQFAAGFLRDRSRMSEDSERNVGNAITKARDEFYSTTEDFLKEVMSVNPKNKSTGLWSTRDSDVMQRQPSNEAQHQKSQKLRK